MSGWVGVDLDGTLAEYHGWHGDGSIGAPIPAMVDRVKAWLDEGIEVRIFTARMAVRGAEVARVQSGIIAWCAEHIGAILQVTNVKDFEMLELWDDRAVAVEANTGRALSPSRRGLS